MYNQNRQRIMNFESENSISAIIYKFEAKNRRDKLNNEIKRKSFTSKMSGEETLQCDEVFYDSLLNIPNGNRNIDSDIATSANESDVKTLRKQSNKSRSKNIVNLVSWFVFLLSSVNGAIATTLTITLFLPKALIKSLIYPGYRLLFGTLYPAYASYKAVRTKNVKEYVSGFRIDRFGEWNFLRYLNYSKLFTGKMDDVLDRFCAIFMH